MRKIFKYILIIILALNSGIMLASDDNIPVRVGVSDTNFKKYLYDTIEFINANKLNVLDSASGYTIPITDESEIVKITSGNNLFRVYVDEELKAKNLTGPILITPKEGNFISLSNLKRKGKQASYRGYMEITRSTKDISKFAVVNVLSLKDYLRGVVPNEMPVRFGLEALKAQSVAARNYAITPRIKAYSEFDLCDSVACQVYYGANTEEELSDKAVEQTNNIIALDDKNKPILALYSSTAGGYTESYAYAFSDPKTREFPSEDISYLQAKPDKKEFNKLNTDEEAEKFYTSKPEAFDDLSPYYRWSKEWTKEELESVLTKTLPAQAKTGFISPAITEGESIGNLISIKALKRGDSGKIIELEIKTDKNIFVVQKELVIRRCFQKNGISLPSANFVINYIDSEMPVYKFFGGGFGHGVGLSQWGAGKMASEGYSFDQILLHYYDGIKLATIPIEISNSDTVEDEFYSNTKKAELLLINSSKHNELLVCINNKELIIPLKEKEMHINISKYLQKGINTISYKVKDEQNQNTEGKLTAFIQIEGADSE